MLLGTEGLGMGKTKGRALCRCTVEDYTLARVEVWVGVLAELGSYSLSVAAESGP